MKTVSIKGKQYVEVNERLKYFRAKFTGYRLLTDIIELTDDKVVFKASVLNENGEVVAIGHAFEEKSSSFINKTSYIENGETSAWGRALANFGIGLDNAVASADEVVNAIRNQSLDSDFTNKHSKELDISELDRLITITNTDKNKFLAHYNITNIKDINATDYSSAINVLRIKSGKK